MARTRERRSEYRYRDADASAAEPTRKRSRPRAAANRFDIRRLIGGLFLLYGVDAHRRWASSAPHHVKTKAAAINIDLWTGMGMLVFGALMVFWALARPVTPEPPETRGQGSGRDPARTGAPDGPVRLRGQPRHAGARGGLSAC